MEIVASDGQLLGPPFLYAQGPINHLQITRESENPWKGVEVAKENPSRPQPFLSAYNKQVNGNVAVTVTVTLTVNAQLWPLRWS